MPRLGDAQLPCVCIVFTGGTISMLPDAVSGAAVPVLRGETILERTPGVAGIADVEAIDWGLVPASHLRFEQVLGLAEILERALVRDHVVGAVVVQGTDTIEETAFAFDLLLDHRKPVVIVGAMRNAGDPGWDGPRNLLDAVRVAADPHSAGYGTLVVIAGSILPADDAVKVDSRALDAFAAPNVGPVGAVRDGRVSFSAPRGAARHLGAIPTSAPDDVALLTVTMGMDGWLVRAALARRPSALVIAATGTGNTHPDVLAAAVEAMDIGVPVVLASRCLRGGVSPAYGFPGGGRQWLDAGAMLAGTMSGPKARICMALASGAGVSGEDLRELLAGPVRK